MWCLCRLWKILRIFRREGYVSVDGQLEALVLEMCHPHHLPQCAPTAAKRVEAVHYTCSCRSVLCLLCFHGVFAELVQFLPRTRA